MAQKSYDEITIGEIMEKADVNRSTYYRNFTSKEEIVKFYFNQIIFHHIEFLLAHPVPMEEYLLGMFTHYYQYKTRLLLIHKAKLTHLILDALNETFSELHADDATESRYTLFYHTGGIYNNFVLWFSNDMQKTPAEMARIACSFLSADFRPFHDKKRKSSAITMKNGRKNGDRGKPLSPQQFNPIINLKDSKCTVHHVSYESLYVSYEILLFSSSRCISEVFLVFRHLKKEFPLSSFRLLF